MNSYTSTLCPISTEERDGVTIVHLQGSLGIETVAELRAALSNQLKRKRSVRLDLKNVSTVDLAGLQLLYSAEISFRTAGADFKVTDMPDPVHEFARSSGFDASAWQEIAVSM